jgi:hypothetical protein
LLRARVDHREWRADVCFAKAANELLRERAAPALRGVGCWVLSLALRNIRDNQGGAARP